MHPLGIGLKKAALACCASALAVGITAPLAYAASAAQYAQWNFAAGLVTVPAKNFPVGHIDTNSTTPQVGSGKSAFLNAATPFSQAFGSSQNQPYALLRLAAGRLPSTTVISFDSTPAPGTWGFALGDVDAENVQVQAYDATGKPVPIPELGFQSVFNFCNGSPLPPSCLGTAGTDVPTWNPTTGHLAGNALDTNGASGWFRPTAALRTLVLTASLNTGVPPPPVTPPDTPAVVKVCDGTAKNIDLVGPPAGGTIDAHPENCTVTYTPKRGFSGEDSFTLKIELPNGAVLVKTFDIRVARTLPDTGAADLVTLALLAAGLTTAGFVLAMGAARVNRTERVVENARG